MLLGLQLRRHVVFADIDGAHRRLLLVRVLQTSAIAHPPHTQQRSALARMQGRSCTILLMLILSDRCGKMTMAASAGHQFTEAFRSMKTR